MKKNDEIELDFSLVPVRKFKEGDEIIHSNNFKTGLYAFFKATEYDVKMYSGKNGVYYKKK